MFAQVLGYAVSALERLFGSFLYIHGQFLAHGGQDNDIYLLLV